MKPKVDFHIKADKAKADMAKELSGLTNRELYELGCQIAIEQNRNVLDTQILELHEAMDKVNELTASIKSRLKDKEVPTRPSDDAETDDEELKKARLVLVNAARITLRNVLTMLGVSAPEKM